MQRGYEVLPENEPYTTDTFAREATAFIDRHSKDPWFLYLTFNAVHTPMHATDKYLERFKNVSDTGRRTYCAMMSAMDDAIGAVLKKLDENRLTENTLVFFVSDNGGPPANSSSNGILRGNKAQTWEGGIRVPYLVQWKGTLPAGKTYDQPVIQLDFAPTALAAAEVEVKDAKFDGVNLLPYLQNKVSAPPHDTLYWRFGQQMAIRHGNYKLVKAVGNDKPELYDLAADVSEKNDLSASKADVQTCKPAMTPGTGRFPSRAGPRPTRRKPRNRPSEPPKPPRRISKTVKHEAHAEAPRARRAESVLNVSSIQY
jgi:arylsulfatase A-like enzyme